MSQLGVVIRFTFCSCVCLAVAAAGAGNISAGNAPKKPGGVQELWQKFPLAGQGTVPASTVPVPHPPPRELKAPLRPPPPAATVDRSGGGGSNLTQWVIVIVVAAIAVAIVFAIAWGVRRRGRAPRDLLRWLAELPDRWADAASGMARRSAIRRRRVRFWFDDTRDRWADALSSAKRWLLRAPQTERPSMRQRTTPKRVVAAFATGGRALPLSPSSSAEQRSHLRLAFRVGRWRRRQDAPPEEDPPAQSTDFHGRIAQYSLRPQEAAEERSDVRPEPDFVESSEAEQEGAAGVEEGAAVVEESAAVVEEGAAVAEEESATAEEVAAPPAPTAAREETVLLSIASHVEVARRQHLALSVAALRLQRQADALHPFDLRRKAESTVHESLGDVAGVEVLLGDEGALWLIIPGVLPKRARVAADHLETLLASTGTHVARIAVLGYPRDAKDAEGLVQKCRELLSNESSDDDGR